ncbi:MAG: multidrug effflux MFS transporter [Gammaproteobacteria bacterium]
MNVEAVTRRAPRPALMLLAFMMSVGPFGDTEYTPAMPAIAHSLNTTYGMVQFTMASYLIGSAISRLVYGPVSDRFGRRPIMLAGAIILVAGGLLCVLSFSIWPLIAGRLIQGVGACAGGVLSDAVVRDAFSADEREGIYAKLMAVFAMAPAVGPIVGVYAASKLGWHGNFALLLALAILLFVLVWRFLPETLLDPNPHALEPRALGRSYWAVLKGRGFLVYSFLGGLCVGVVYAALIGAPALVYTLLGLGDFAIMIVAAAIFTAFVIGSGLCALASDRIPDLWIFSAGLWVMLAGGAGLLAVAVLLGKEATFASLLAPIAVSFIGVGLIIPATTANAVAPFKENAGAASSMFGFILMGTAALATGGMSGLPSRSELDMPIVFLSLTLIAILMLVGYVIKCGGVVATIASFPTPQRRSR